MMGLKRIRVPKRDDSWKESNLLYTRVTLNPFLTKMPTAEELLAELKALDNALERGDYKVHTFNDKTR